MAKARRKAKRSGKKRSSKSTRARAEPRARLEFVDVATGEPKKPAPPERRESDGTAPTGRVVADLEGTEVEIDHEDLIGHPEGDHPREQSYRFDVEGPTHVGGEDYRAQARAKAAAEQRAGRPVKKPRAFRATFDSSAQAARDFYDANALFFDHVRDPADGLRDWADGIDVRTGRRTSKRLINTPKGQAILAEPMGEPQILAALRFVFGQARGRRWDAVQWEEIDRLDEALRPLWEPFAETEAATPGIYWRPVAGEATAEQLEELSPTDRDRLADWESAEEVRTGLADLREAYARNLDCLEPAQRTIIERRIAEWNRWARDPSKIPPYACEPDARTGGYTCNYPSVAGELAELRTACERAYDPDWAEPEGRAAAAGYPDLSRGPEDPTVEPPAEALEVGALEVAELRQLADDGRAYGAARPAVQERRELGGVLYQLEFRTCGKRNPATGRPWCWCFGQFPNGGHGPYWYAYDRDERGRRRSTYRGKTFREV